LLGSTDRRDLELLVEALVDIYYVMLSLGAIVRESTRIWAQGYQIRLPTEFVKATLILMDAGRVLDAAWKAIYSPARIVSEELKISRFSEGRLDIPLTSKLRGRGLALIATRKRKMDLESIENIFLKAVLERMKSELRSILNNIDNFACKDEVYEIVFKGFTSNLKQELAAICNNIDRLNDKTFLRYIRITPALIEDRALKTLALRILEKGLYPYSLIARMALDYIKMKPIALLTRYVNEARQVEKTSLRLWDYKLYEVYTYYTVVYSIVKALEPFKLEFGEDYALLKADKHEILITYDRSPECKSWFSHGKVKMFDGNKVVFPPGKPDIAVHVNDVVKTVGDAKYRVSVKELSQARFKVLGYMHEYSAPIGALFFDPMHITYREEIDSEDRDFVVFLEKAIKCDGFLIERNSNDAFYVVPLKPMSYNQLLRSRILDVLMDMAEKLTSYN